MWNQPYVSAAPPVFDSQAVGGTLNSANLTLTTVSPNTYVIVDVATDPAATVNTPTIAGTAMTRLATSGGEARFGLAVATAGTHSIAVSTGQAWDASTALAYTNVAHVLSTTVKPTSVTLTGGQIAVMAWGAIGTGHAATLGTPRAFSQDSGYDYVYTSETTVSMDLSSSPPTFLTILSST